jgi:processive 1,2-diacylglycerol beta-glucosyltransferase
MKKVLILTAGYGEGHNAAARGVRDGLARLAPDAAVEMRDLFAEAYGPVHKIVRKAYLALINRWPRSWGLVYWWLDHKKDFDKNFARFSKLKDHLGRLLASFQPDVVVSTFPPYPYVLEQIWRPNRACKNVAVVTDSITVNAIWYRSRADYFLVPNEQSAAVVRAGGIAPEKIRTFGFPVSPQFADLAQVRQSDGLVQRRDRQPPSQNDRRVLYVISAGTAKAPELVRKLLDLDVELTVTVGRNEQLRYAIEKAVGNRKARPERSRRIDIVGWTNELPRMLCRSHLLISKAGGATVQETIAARCPMIINHVVSGQEEGNAHLIVETNSGVIAKSATEVVAQVQRAFADDAKQWREWSTNINKLSRPRASLDIAEFLLSI